jgi:hypothetical protein
VEWLLPQVPTVEENAWLAAAQDAFSLEEAKGGWWEWESRAQ